MPPIPRTRLSKKIPLRHDTGFSGIMGRGGRKFQKHEDTQNAKNRNLFEEDGVGERKGKEERIDERHENQRIRHTALCPAKRAEKRA